MTIQTRLSMTMAGLLALLSLGIGLGLYSIEKSFLVRKSQDARLAQADQLSMAVRDAWLVHDDLALANAVTTAAATSGARAVFLVDPKGTLLIHSDPAHTRGTAAPAPGPDDIRVERDILRIGRLVMLYSRRAIDSHVRNALRPLAGRLAAVTAALFLLSLLLAGLLARGLTAPLARVARASRALARGGWDGQGLDVHRSDELGDLARDFDEMARRLKELDQMKEDFISNVTHELRSPLSAIESYVNAMLEKCRSNGDGNTLDYLRIIRNNTTRLRRFIDDLLDLAKLESRHVSLRRTRLSADGVLRDSGALFQSMAREKHIILDVNAEPGLTLLADEDKVHQVLSNFLSNALKFTPVGGRVALAATLAKGPPGGAGQGRFVRFSVTDTGPGIAPQDQARLFNRFEQVKDSRDRIDGPKGTGLGLAIAKGIVETHGGVVGIESTPGKGSVFFADFPAPEAP